ncbi:MULTISPECIES: PTS sugar transporter subunit IIB [Enorma]|uniref:PTS mannose/fructose/sorbose transporter subunit IIB n=2 Tax=Enorma TaxID=1472762 RepID=A0A1Y3U3M6_9ACTN|nr:MULTISPECIES: PTS sugar transporter subunit IIB [Enorma]SCH68515.1 Probable phosphotransferase enzyme IIB component M6_Spy0801 [uncultured Collinsella sp.]MCI7775001.1 PTS sugar transporter subunit IIB [Enorma sp.]MRX80501.1 PTS mannose/fructose/sorbose transporter subunit IIB [Enorma shizhengliae]OUN43393.1 PTS mannose/fructose/sorbose transporter subunit IIB [Enorma massiliensis]HJG62398.1 PTS sugar transporter subunit IIB [Enorma massiliensis]
MIKMTRVDHRLLHGQVAFTWIRQVGADCILIANDAVAKDELRMSVLRMAKPQGVKLVMKSVDDSIKALTSGVTDKYNLFIITESIEDAWRLCKAVPAIRELNIGGVKVEDGKRQISEAVFVSDEECARIRELDAAGVHVFVQMTPSERSDEAMKLIG